MLTKQYTITNVMIIQIMIKRHDKNQYLHDHYYTLLGLHGCFARNFVSIIIIHEQLYNPEPKKLCFFIPMQNENGCGHLSLLVAVDNLATVALYVVEFHKYMCL